MARIGNMTNVYTLSYSTGQQLCVLRLTHQRALAPGQKLISTIALFASKCLISFLAFNFRIFSQRWIQYHYCYYHWPSVL